MSRKKKSTDEHPRPLEGDGQPAGGGRLEQIQSPQDLHTMSEQQLADLAQEVRTHIIDTVGEIGGHFGANLGTCELAVALHSLLDSPRDKILWDVGHQAYPHKVLTGRRDQLDTIRKYADAGYDTVFVHQIGPDQDGFLRFFGEEVLPKV